MSDKNVSKFSSLEEIYPEAAVDNERKRWNTLGEAFQSLYGSKPHFITRSPGRVNIIGEHIDYMLYDVLPMAITADIIIAVIAGEADSNGPAEFSIANSQNDKFLERKCSAEADKDLEIDPDAHDWTNYFKAGYNGALNILRKRSDGPFTPRSMLIMVDGTVPSGSGLSSSAAFVCASVLATLVANGVTDIDKNELVELAIVSERAVGVNSGGMDQSASVLAAKGAALFVSFEPELYSQPIHFPKIDPEIAFVIAQTFVKADKKTTAPVNYNLRVVETSLAAHLLAKKLLLPRPSKDAGPLSCSIRGVQDAYFDKQDGAKNSRDSRKDFMAQIEQMLELAKTALDQIDGYTIEGLCKALEMSSEEFDKLFTSKFPVRADRFMLRQRTTHVLAEAYRVQHFVSILESAPKSSTETYQALGELMDQSQDSCRELYDCSCPELDEMCEIARRNGSYGSRLTGAGWGGCCVHLVPAQDAKRVTEAFKNEYYATYFPDMTAEDLDSAIIMSRPGGGAGYFSFTG